MKTHSLLVYKNFAGSLCGQKDRDGIAYDTDKKITCKHCKNKLKKIKMEITYSRQREKKKPYINFRMRKLIFQFMFEKCGDAQLAQQIADNCETIVSENFWVKDKRGVNVKQTQKAA